MEVKSPYILELPHRGLIPHDRPPGATAARAIVRRDQVAAVDSRESDGLVCRNRGKRGGAILRSLWQPALRL